jgi:hypothetical protein
LPLERRRLLGHHLGDDGLRGAAGERRIAGEHLVGHHAKGVHVAPGGDRALAHGLLGRHVVRRAERHAGLGHAGAAAGTRDGQRDPKVRDQRRAVVQQDVLRLDVAVNHPVPVSVVQRGRYLGGNAHRIRDGKLLLALQSVAEGFPLHERHHVVGGAVGRARIDQAEDVGVLQVGDGLDLAEKPLGADDRGKLGPEHLDGDLPIVLEILREIHGRHAARTQLPLDPIAVGER